MNCKTIKEANLILFQRYLDILNKEEILESNENLITAKKMTQTALDMDMFEDKQSRWLGFIQGICFMNKLIDVDEERDFSRELFHSAYKNMGLEKPDTIFV